MPKIFDYIKIDTKSKSATNVKAFILLMFPVQFFKFILMFGEKSMKLPYFLDISMGTKASTCKVT